MDVKKSRLNDRFVQIEWSEIKALQKKYLALD